MKITRYILFALLYCLSGCNSQRTYSEEVNTLHDCGMYDFKEALNNDIWNWSKFDSLEKVDSSFFNRYLSKFEVFRYNADYQSLYRYCSVQLGNGTEGIVVLQTRPNNSIAKMFLVYGKERNSQTTKILQLAAIEKSPDDFLFLTSQFLDSNTIRRTSVFHSTDAIEFKDSVVSIYRLSFGTFSLTERDSVRLILN